MALHEIPDGTVVRALGLGVKETAWKFTVAPVIGDAIAAFPPPFAVVGAGAVLQVRLLGAFHNHLLR